MTTKQKQQKIKSLVKEMIKQTNQQMVKKLETVLKSGAIDIESWDENDKPMVIPKCIITALLESESVQYSARGTSFEKQMKKEVNNIRYYI